MNQIRRDILMSRIERVSNRRTFVSLTAVLAIFALMFVFLQPRAVTAQGQWSTTSDGRNISNVNPGNVGIGTNSPTEGKLQIIKDSAYNDGSSGALLLRNATAPSKGIYFGYDNGIDAGFLQAIHPGAAYKNFLLNPNGGNVGIGTMSPVDKLHIFGADPALKFATSANAVKFKYITSEGAAGQRLGFFGGGNTELISFMNTGFVGIGTTAPTAKLDVNGNINVTGSINAKYQDIAEWVPSTQALAAGTVVVLDPERANHVLASSKIYDTRVAGVVSGQPGITLGEGGVGKLMIATTGRVRIKVDASRGPIHVGDLLVTGDKVGVAMKSVPLNLEGTQIHRPGTLIGKALEPLGAGVGEILVLLSLQ
jgi:hypothetical protein